MEAENDFMSVEREVLFLSFILGVFGDGHFSSAIPPWDNGVLGLSGTDFARFLSQYSKSMHAWPLS
jgi:hypothetical protein